MSKKGATYRLMFTTDLNRLIVDLNVILTQLEDRFDRLEGLRQDYTTTQVWEREYIQKG